MHDLNELFRNSKKARSYWLVDAWPRPRFNQSELIGWWASESARRRRGLIASTNQKRDKEHEHALQVIKWAKLTCFTTDRQDLLLHSGLIRRWLDILIFLNFWKFSQVFIERKLIIKGNLIDSFKWQKLNNLSLQKSLISVIRIDLLGSIKAVHHV